MSKGVSLYVGRYAMWVGPWEGDLQADPEALDAYNSMRMSDGKAEIEPNGPAVEADCSSPIRHGRTARSGRCSTPTRRQAVSPVWTSGPATGGPRSPPSAARTAANWPRWRGWPAPNWSSAGA